jgi:signal peptidase I
MASSSETDRQLGVIRDTVESIWVAIVLAFVLRAFMFEAFVIPTGSMAPRLVGEHWHLRCPCCGLAYDYGLPGRPGVSPPRRGERGQPRGQPRCPNCGYPFLAYGDAHYTARYLDGGDRVLVLKYIYRFQAPRPWDVIVFRNPQNNRENYIKRLIGLPGETIEIVRGDVFFRTDEGPWRIRRKERDKTQDAMWQIVFDNDYRPDTDLIQRLNAGLGDDKKVHPPAWFAPAASAEHWTTDPADEATVGGRRFLFDGDRDGCELRLDAERGVFGPRYGYNSTPGGVPGRRWQREVCSDLKLSFTFIPREAGSTISLVLTNMHHRFRGELRADGTATLYHSHPGEHGGEERVWASADVGRLTSGRGYELALWHADYRVVFQVDDRARLQSSDEAYRADVGRIKQELDVAEARLRPVEEQVQQFINRPQPPRDPAEARAAKAAYERLEEVLEEVLPVPKPGITAGGGACELAHVRLMRDVYYTCPDLQLPNQAETHGVQTEYARNPKVAASPGDPGWGITANPIKLKRNDDDPDLDEFFVLGDNSPQSLDGRAWVAAAPTLRLWRRGGRIVGEYEFGAEPVYSLGTVPRYNIIGRALFVYWPSGFRPPGLPGLPMIPNVGRMRLIR